MAGAKRKRILVAGGGGFLGAHLCRQLLEAGHDVVCIDNFSSGSRRNIEHLESFKSFSLFEHDVTEPFVLPHVDEIYNLACVASPVQYQRSPIQALHTSAQGIDNLLQLALATGAAIFQASTSEVYGNPLVHPQSEDYFGNVNPIGPRACYDEGKRYAETLCMDYARVHKVRVRIARIFNSYGPFMQPDDGRVVSNFIVQALQNRPLTIYGDGSQTRSFCYVDDMIGGIRALMDSSDDVNGPVNLGNPGEFTMLELADLVLELTGSSSKVVFTGLPTDDPVKRCPDITRARHLLDWAPSVKLRDGLEKTIAYFDTLLGNAPVAQLSNTWNGTYQSPKTRKAAL
ncbi:UDP-glucuronic acid decarboxylase family protein [Gilvimarinus sp. F26214L]|uniref:UDP-glucuronic acid decarboxylase family protein n=1 Tax=Gilvimarinus sp. DZF01 TaxID=3461371 RepID=UPI0040452520